MKDTKEINQKLKKENKLKTNFFLELLKSIIIGKGNMTSWVLPLISMFIFSTFFLSECANEENITLYNNCYTILESYEGEEESYLNDSKIYDFYFKNLTMRYTKAEQFYQVYSLKMLSNYLNDSDIETYNKMHESLNTTTEDSVIKNMYDILKSYNVFYATDDYNEAEMILLAQEEAYMLNHLKQGSNSEMIITLIYFSGICFTIIRVIGNIIYSLKKKGKTK